MVGDIPEDVSERYRELVQDPISKAISMGNMERAI